MIRYGKIPPPANVRLANETKTMYYYSDALRQPSPTQVMWRYMDLCRLASLISTKQLYFCNVTRFEDPHEAIIPANTFAEIKDTQADEAAGLLLPSYKGMRKSLGTLFGHLRKGMFANCWHMSEHQSVAMWKLYLPNEKEGVAVKSTFHRITESLRQTTQPICGGIVSYVDFDNDSLEMGNYLKIVVTKRCSFEHENEFRLVYQDVKANYSELMPGVLIPVDIGTLLESVYVSPKSDHGFLERVEMLCRDNAIAADVIRSTLYDPPPAD